LRRDVNRHFALLNIALKGGLMQQLPPSMAQLFARVHIAILKMQSTQILPLNEAVGLPIFRMCHKLHT
jgi:hypothetical protein